MFTRAIADVNSKPQQLTQRWKRHQHLIPALIWTDVLASVTQNKASKLLPLYRVLLGNNHGDGERLHMESVMGCDSTTVSLPLGWSSRILCSARSTRSEWKSIPCWLWLYHYRPLPVTSTFVMSCIASCDRLPWIMEDA